jgi:hypothetical protein
MIALANNLNVSSGEDFRKILAIGAQIGGDLRLADEIGNGTRFAGLAARKPIKAPPAEPPREYPPISEVGKIWSMGLAIETDTDASDYLRGRQIDPAAATRLGLAHVLANGCTVPAWATCKAGPWSTSGYRLIVRAWDAGGKLRSVRSWQVDGAEGPKRLPPSGHKQAGLVQANACAVKMLLGQAPAGRVLICEGEPDWMTWSTRVPADVAVFGIGSGAWTPEHAAKIPKGSEVLILTHRDPAGHKYAKHVLDTLSEKLQVWRFDGEIGSDENERANLGTLPSDPRDGCIPWNDAARKVAEEEPRFYTVKQLLQDAHKRLVSTEPVRMWTSGHWKVDLMTGGFRPDSCWVIGAASSWGKSSIAISIADENIRNWHTKAKVMIVSCEDSEELYADRLLARRARVNALRLRDKRLTPEEHQRVAEVLSQAEDVPVYLDGRGVTFERLIRQIDRMIVEHDIDITVLDYIQECRTKTKHEDDRRMFREIASLFRHTVKRRKKSGAIMTQLTTSDPGRPPTKDNIRECKDIGHGAEVIALGWEPLNQITAGKDTFEAGAKLLLLDKAKNGRKGSIELEWDNVSACFNRTLKPAGSQEDEVWYEQEADISQAIGAMDFDDPYR